jgi:nicotinate phosphoribosyltransferase
MSVGSRWVSDDNIALLTDLYQLTMLQAYWREQMTGPAVFSLFVRRLPQRRNFLLACGLADALTYLENLRFTTSALDHLARTGRFAEEFLAWLGEYAFGGDVYAVPEGTPVFGGEPLLEVVAPLPQAQLVESFLLNQVHFQTVVASKAARVVQAASGHPVVDFGLRRIHGADAALKAARAFRVAGVEATSNVLAGQLYSLPLAGTMAHSYVQAHVTEFEALGSFADIYPDGILLVDTYDTIAGVEKVVALARQQGKGFRVRGIRLDSGDLAELATAARRMLDDAGLTRVQIFASGGLDEEEIALLLSRKAPIDAFGVGTRMGVSEDAPALDMVYKMTSYGGEGRLKLSPAKEILAGRKQVYRLEESGRAVRDVVALAGEDGPGRPLLRQVMADGGRLPPVETELDTSRELARVELDRLPSAIRQIERADPPYPVELSAALQRYQREVRVTLR